LTVPQSKLKIGHLKSLLESSYIDCLSLDLTLSDDFDNCHIFDLKSSSYIDPLAKESQVSDPSFPTLYIKAEHIDLKIMSRFEILRRSI
jgi:hypothetical protein